MRQEVRDERAGLVGEEVRELRVQLALQAGVVVLGVPQQRLNVVDENLALRWVCVLQPVLKPRSVQLRHPLVPDGGSQQVVVVVLVLVTTPP